MSDKASIIHDHYKDTCSIIAESIKRRDRLMLFVLLSAGFLAFQALFPGTSNSAVNDFLTFKYGLKLNLNFSVIGSVVWYLLLIFTVRYFQVAVFIERKYNYIHKVEDHLNKELSDEVITREGKSYLDKYPLFSDWMWILYTIMFPLLLVFTSTAKIISELRYVKINGWSYPLVLDSVAFVLLTVSILLYLSNIHRKK